MRRFVFLAVCSLAALPLVSWAQVRESVRFRALVSSSHETPAALQGVQAAGNGVVEFILTRDAAGALTAAKVDFRVEFFLGQSETLTNMHVHRGAEGVDGPVVVPSNFGPAIPAGPGLGVLFRPMQTTDPVQLAVIEEILANPSAFYLNLHSTSAPAGIMRGQLQPEEPAVAAVQALQPQLDAILAEVAKIDTAVDLLRRITLRLGLGN